jgi:perosamine synthetase
MISVNKFKLEQSDKQKLISALNNNWISSAGPEVTEFENKFKKLIGKKYCSSVSSGSAALDIALKVINLKKNDEVIIPNFTIISSAISVIKLGAKPIPIDCDLYNWNMKINLIEKNISKKTKAILATHIYGYPIEIDKIKKICKKYNLILIEDAAEMLGHKYQGKYCGSFGDLSIFSFYSNKHITTGEGGMVLTSNKKFKDKIFDYKNLCFGKQNRFNHYDIGWNYRYTNLQAALGINQIKRIKKIIRKKKEIGKSYYSKLYKLSNIYIQKPKIKNFENVYWVVGILILNKKMTAEKFRNELKKDNIETRSFFWPMNKQKAFKKYNIKFKGNFTNSEYISKYGFYVPSGLNTSQNDINHVCKSIIKIKNKYNF